MVFTPKGRHWDLGPGIDLLTSSRDRDQLLKKYWSLFGPAIFFRRGIFWGDEILIRELSVPNSFENIFEIIFGTALWNSDEEKVWPGVEHKFDLELDRDWVDVAKISNPPRR